MNIFIYIQLSMNNLILSVFWGNQYVFLNSVL